MQSEFGDVAESFCKYNHGEFNFPSVVDASGEILNNNTHESATALS